MSQLKVPGISDLPSDVLKFQQIGSILSHI